MNKSSLTKAIEDRDYIYAVIKGSDVNHDGKSFSLRVAEENRAPKLLRIMVRLQGASKGA